MIDDSIPLVGQKTRLDIFVGKHTLLHIWEFMSKHGSKNYSQAVESILIDYFRPKDEDLGISRLNQALAQKDAKIQNLEYELKLKNTKVLINESLSHEKSQ